MTIDFTGRSILVTGGGSGIGRAVALRCAEIGAAVTVTDFDAESGKAVCGDILSAGGTAQFVEVDVTDESAVIAAVDAAVARYGHLDGACNSAGMTFSGAPFHEIATASWRRVHAVNLKGMFFSMKHECRAMLAHGNGAIVNIASTAAIAGIPNGAEYCSAKAGVVGATRAAATDYALRSVRVNAVLPGGTRTKMMEHAFSKVEGLRDAVPRANPMGRLGEPDEIAFAVRWLLSSEASFVTGVALPIDGGLTMI